MRNAIGTVLITLVLAGCGGGGSTESAPSEAASNLKVERHDGLAWIPVNTMAEAEELCEQVEEDWPDRLQGQSQVTFDLPNTGSDYTCVKG